jgi:hypothetical protein
VPLPDGVTDVHPRSGCRKMERMWRLEVRAWQNASWCPIPRGCLPLSSAVQPRRGFPGQMYHQRFGGAGMSAAAGAGVSVNTPLWRTNRLPRGDLGRKGGTGAIVAIWGPVWRVSPATEASGPVGGHVCPVRGMVERESDSACLPAAADRSSKERIWKCTAETARPKRLGDQNEWRASPAAIQCESTRHIGTRESQKGVRSACLWLPIGPRRGHRGGGTMMANRHSVLGRGHRFGGHTSITLGIWRGGCC